MGQVSAVGSFAGGTVNVAGEISFSSRTSTLAVIGGTRAYATARGELIIRTIGNVENSNKSAQTLRLWL
jgi:Dirigent-like protein